MNPTFEIEHLDPKELRANPLNFRRHPETQRTALAGSLAEHGWLAAPIWNRRSGHLLDGHARVELAVEKDEAMIPVRVIDVPLAQEKRILRAFDRIGGMAEEDPQALERLIEEIGDVDLERLLGEITEPESGLLPEADPDEVPEEVETRCQAGDVWELGWHRIGCIDSRDEDHVRRLVADDKPGMVFADPPYGISAVQVAASGKGSIGGSKPFGKMAGGTPGKTKIISSGTYVPIIGDETTSTAIEAYELAASLWPDAVQVWWGGNHYANALPPSSCWLVWDKENTGTFGDAELAWLNQPTAVRIFRHMWNGLLKASERGEKRVHPTQKPVALAEWVFTSYGKEGDTVFDPFLGSGMSLIAAEKIGRRLIGAEMSPEYIDVCIARWEQATGKSARRVE